MSAFGTLSASTTAVLFIEFQNEFASEGGKLNAAVQPCMDAVGTVDNASKVLEACRAKGIKVLHAPITFSDDFRELSTAGYGILANVKAGECFKASQWGGAIIDKMQPTPEEIVVAGKRGLCGFASTNLDFILRQHGITTLAICGFLTNCCVEILSKSILQSGTTQGELSTTLAHNKKNRD